MSVRREEDRQKNGCSSRGLGIAAAAIGVGVGAALYYFFNKREELPNTEGSTSDWNCEREHAFHRTSSYDSYTTISEHETSDTSVHDFSLTEGSVTDESLTEESLTEESITEESFAEDSFNASVGSPHSIMHDSIDDSDHSYTSSSSSDHSDIRSIVSSNTRNNVPRNTRSWVRQTRTHLTEEQQIAMIREEQFRERAWTLEDCSICFDVMLCNQQVTQLPCAHNFHTGCILKWLEERQTCPICRKAAE